MQQQVASTMGFGHSYLFTRQTYLRNVDSQILNTLSGIAQNAHNAATHLRLLAGRKEIEEPIETEEIGSSATGYKRHTMRCKPICSLARLLTSLQSTPANTLVTQWLERTTDDSANGRLVLPHALINSTSR